MSVPEWFENTYDDPDPVVAICTAPLGPSTVTVRVQFRTRRDYDVARNQRGFWVWEAIKTKLECLAPAQLPIKFGTAKQEEDASPLDLVQMSADVFEWVACSPTPL